jgi:hypothetical protein
MVNEELNGGQEELITIPKSEYDHLNDLADIAEGRTSFWTDALESPEGTRALKEFFQGILETGLTFWGEKILKGQLRYSIYRITIVVALLTMIVVIATWLTSNGKLDAGAFTFLMGTIVGYILAFLTKIELTGSL